MVEDDDAVAREPGDVTARETAVREVEDCWFVAGEETFVIKVRVADVAALEATIREVNAISGVARTRTTVVLSTKFEARIRPADPELR